MPDIDLKVIVPDRWKHYGSWRSPEIDDPAGPICQSKVVWPWMGPAQFYLHWYPGLKRILKTFRPDVIDLWEEPWGLVSAHTCWLRNRLLPATRIISETEQNLNRVLPPPFEYFRSYTQKNADFLIGRSNEAVEVAMAKGYRGPAQTVPNAVDNALFRPLNRQECRIRLDWSTSEFLVGYVGRLVDRKGLMDLVQAIELCPSPVKVVFVGDGPLQPWIDEQSKRREIQGRIYSVSAMPLEELPRVMNSLDVLALPSRTVPTWKEQFGRVIIEAHSCGIPVVGSDSGAIPEVVGDGGVIFPEGDVPKLAQAITKLYSDANFRTSAGAAGLSQVEAHYTWQRVAEQMAAIYRVVSRISK